jgi:predicted Zn-ribbon and HTH transcriptional regulator
MINIDFAAFISIFLDSSIIIYFVLYVFSDRDTLRREKKILLTKKTCEICKFSSFLNSQKSYWRCPSCESLNRGE